jgi:hypothetical protein
VCRYTASRIAEVAQLVEHRSEKPGVDSSILSLGTTILNTNWSYVIGHIPTEL